MFVIYHSNSLELFTRLVISIMSNYRLSNPMTSEIILIENRITEKWIEIELSNYFGISANITFMSIKSFIKKISSDALYTTDLDINDFSYDFMYWKFMSILPKLAINQSCSIIQKYLYNDYNQQKCGQLSMYVTDLFLQYLTYRSDWLNTWEIHQIIDNLDIEHQTWQSEAWRMLLNEYPVRDLKKKTGHNLLDYCIFFIQNKMGQLKHNKLPNRIFIYSITSIPIVYWKILNLLSKYINIYLWFMNPCINNWSNIFNKKTSGTKKKIYKLYHNHSLEPKLIKKKYDLSLLNLWGSYGKDTLLFLNQLKSPFSIKSFVIPKKNSMLHILQRNILKTQSSFPFFNPITDLTNHTRNSANKKRYIINSDDRSITFHQCHHIQREIEVLHNNLLLMLSNDSSLLPGDIIVIAPNIYDYEPAIKNIFNNVFNRQLPFSISGSYDNTCSITSSIFNILDLWRSRFISEEILSLLSIPSTISKFNMSIREVELIRIWVIESGIRWGLDQETMKFFDVPIIDQNTWYFGLKRMLLGHAMHKQYNKLWENIYPYSYANEECIETVAKLGNFLNVLKKWRDRLSRIYTLKSWLPFIQEIIDDFFDDTQLNEEENNFLILLKTYWIDIVESGIKTGYSKKINIVILQDQLKFKLNKKRVKCKFSPNVINFCDITPVCCVPCKVLCIIGINDNTFPNQSSSYDFDLIIKKKRLGDYNVLKRDHYTFLLECLLPTERLYISFINKIVNHNYDMRYHESILIDEFLEYIAQDFCLIGDHDLSVIDNAKCLRKYLFQQYSYTSFDSDNFITNTKKQSFAKEWWNSVNVSNICSYDLIYFNSFDTSLSKISNIIISFQDLYNFYWHPIRTWFQKRLGVYFSTCKKLANDEPFFMNERDRYLLNTKLIDYIIHDKKIDELYQESCATGIMPHGSFGKLCWENQYEQMKKLSNQIQIYYSDCVSKLNIDLVFDTIRLIGQLQSVQKDGIIRWKVANLNMKDCFLLWLEHLIYCSMGGSGDSRLFGTNNNIWHFPNFSASIAKKLLAILINGYCVGMNTPLMLLYRSGGTWMDYMFDRDNKTVYSDHDRQQKARQKLIQVWQGYNSSGDVYCSIGECQDLYLRKLIPFDLDEIHIQNIINTAKQYFLNIMQYRIS